LPTVKTQDQDSARALTCLSLCHSATGGAWAVVVAAEREGGQGRRQGDTLRGGRVQATHGLRSKWGEGAGEAQTGALMALQRVRVGLSDGSAVSGDAGGGRATGTPECVALQAKAEELEGASKSKVEEDEERPGHGSLLRGCRGGGAQC